MRKSSSAFDSSGNGERVHEMRSDPPAVGHLLHRRERDVGTEPPVVGRRGRDRLARRPHDGVATDVARRRKSPRAAHERADADTERLSLSDVRDLPLARGQ